MCCGHYSCTKRDECEVRSFAQGIQEIGLTSSEVMEMVMKCYKNRSSLRTELRNRQGVHGAVEGPCKPEERARLDLIKDWVHAHGGRLRKKRWLVKAPPSRMTYTGGGGMPPIDAIAPEESEDDQPEGAWQGAACDAENEPPCTASDDAALESGHASGAEETSFTDDEEEEDEESAQLLASMLESVKDDDLRKESFFVKVRIPKFCSHAPWC